MLWKQHPYWIQSREKIVVFEDLILNSIPVSFEKRSITENTLNRREIRERKRKIKRIFRRAQNQFPHFYNLGKMS